MSWMALIILTAFVGLFLYIPANLFLGFREDRRILAKAESINKKWLEDELKLPMYKVLVFTKGSKDYHISKSFTPTTGRPWQTWPSEEIDFNRETSLEKAERFMNRVIASGAYYDLETNLMIPVCEIEFMRASNE